MKKTIIPILAFTLCEKRGDAYIVRYDPQPMLDLQGEQTGDCICYEKSFNFLPNIFEVRDAVEKIINTATEELIRSGYTFEGNLVWLSDEDQFNYKAAYDLCVQTQGQGVLPLTIKIGTTDNPVYKTFNTLEEFGAFYLPMFLFIQATLAAGWAKKDAVNYDEYDTALRGIANAAQNEI